jgi:RHS repeat-associated protein
MNSVYRLLAECRLLAHGRGRRGRQRRHRLRPPQRAAAGLGRDPFGRVVEQRWTSSVGVTDDFVYGYDRNGNALYRANLLNHNFDELYHASGAGQGYDNFNEIVAFARGVLSASVPGGPLDTVANPTTLESWRLNAVGGMSSVTVNGATQNRSYNAQNQATTVGNATLTYDKAGNVTADQTGQQLVYDAWGRLVKVLSASGAVLAAYAYDGLGRRIQETASGITTDLYYDQQGNVLEEDVGGVAKAQYVYSPADGSLIERDRDATGNGQLSERLYAQTDANGDVTALVNAAGQVVERYVYDPYGTVTVLDANWNTRAGSQYAWRYLFQGGRYDPATGYYHFGARDYSPSLGSWLEQDPLGLGAGDPNVYRFVGGNPVNATDPSGLTEEDRRQEIYGAYFTALQGQQRYMNQERARTGYRGPIPNMPLAMLQGLGRASYAPLAQWGTAAALVYQMDPSLTWQRIIAIIGPMPLPPLPDQPPRREDITDTPARMPIELRIYGPGGTLTGREAFTLARGRTLEVTGFAARESAMILLPGPLMRAVRWALGRGWGLARRGFRFFFRSRAGAEVAIEVARAWRTYSPRLFRHWLEHLESLAGRAGRANPLAGRLSEAETRELLDYLRSQGWRWPRGVEEGWRGGRHINIYGPHGEHIHLPVPPGFEL